MKLPIELRNKLLEQEDRLTMPNGRLDVKRILREIDEYKASV